MREVREGPELEAARSRMLALLGRVDPAPGAAAPLPLHAELVTMLRFEGEEQEGRLAALLAGKEELDYSSGQPQPVLHEHNYVVFGRHPQDDLRTGPHPAAGQPKRWAATTLVRELTGHSVPEDHAVRLLRDAGWPVVT